jgi:cytochrome bd-I ubiquinol oxidase subunit X
MSLKTLTPFTEGTEIMWYFAWILGLPLAAIFAVMNAMWLELKEDEKLLNRDGPTPSRKPRG